MNISSTFLIYILTCVAIFFATILVLFNISYTKTKYCYTKPSFKNYSNWNLKKRLYVTNPWEENDIVLSDEGPASWKPLTLFQIFDGALKNRGKTMIHFKKEYPIDHSNKMKLRQKEQQTQQKQKEKQKKENNDKKDNDNKKGENKKEKNKKEKNKKENNTKKKEKEKEKHKNEEKEEEIKYEWKEWTLNETYLQVEQVARSLINLGLKPWESVCIIGFNSPEWIISHFGTIYAGGLPIGIYTTNNSGQCKYIAKESKTKIVIIEDNLQLEKYVDISSELDLLKCIVVWNDYIDENLKKKCDKPIYSWKEFLEFGDGKKASLSLHSSPSSSLNDENKYKLMNKNELNEEIKKRISNIKPTQCCTVIYTSGTTGKPKGVMLSHDNIIWITRTLIQEISKDINMDKDHQHRLVSFLPLSHILAQGCDIFAPLIFACDHNINCTIHFARKDALKGSLQKTLQYTEPTLLLTVPQVYEKMYEGFYSIINKPQYFLFKILIKCFLFIGKRNYYRQFIFNENNNNNNNNVYKQTYMFDFINKYILSIIRKQFGLNKIEYAAYGGSPLRNEMKDFFGSINVPLMGIYGLSEAPVCTVNTKYYHNPQSVGHPLNGTETVIRKIEEKEEEKKGKTNDKKEDDKNKDEDGDENEDEDEDEKDNDNNNDDDDDNNNDKKKKDGNDKKKKDGNDKKKKDGNDKKKKDGKDEKKKDGKDEKKKDGNDKKKKDDDDDDDDDGDNNKKTKKSKSKDKKEENDEGDDNDDNNDDDDDDDQDKDNDSDQDKDDDNDEDDEDENDKDKDKGKNKKKDDDNDDNDDDDDDDDDDGEKKKEEEKEKGEICIRGRHLMMGYLYNLEKTKEAIDKDGFFRSGDLGKIDENDFLFITGREKDLLVTQGGENVAPTPIEKYIKKNNKKIANCVVIGDDKKFLTLLVTLKNGNNNNSQTKKSIQKTIDQYNQDKQYCVSNAQKIQKFKILSHDFSQKKDEITPTMKIKRSQIVKNYKKEIEEMYQGKAK